MRTRSPPSSAAVTSTGTMASAPSGTGAPVMMRMAWPVPPGVDGAAPAASVPTTSSSTGAPEVSAARTAYPSMAVLANGGTGSEATTRSARTQPRASSSGIDTGGRAWQAARTCRRASSRGISATASDDAGALDVLGQPLPEGRAEIVAGEGQLDGGAQVVELVADVVAALLERVAVHLLGVHQPADAVGELDLAAVARLDVVE